jgi:primosomal protein N' (replication factor Y)
VVIGARSAIFAPLADPGLIIVDEEHDPAYKQEDLLRYQARDLAILRASQQHCPIILGSATPSLISYQNARQGKYQLLTMDKRIHDRSLPTVEIVNLREQPLVNGRPPLFSPQLLKAMAENLAKNNQSLLFLNRRGFANLVICRDCGHIVQCRNCQVSLTMHKKTAALTCHYCGYTVKSAIVCPSCLSNRINEVGFGTERVEIELEKLFPQAAIARLDKDTTSKRANFVKILKEVRANKIDILIGTQMITKGHHFPNMTLVGIIWADGGLGMPDFRAGERTFQLLSQVSGRAGRGDKPGRVIVQTHQPNHYSITTARDHDYQNFFSRELALRAALNFPPYGRLINLKFSGKNENLVKKSAVECYQKIKKVSLAKKISLLGPAPAPLARLRNLYRWQLLLKGNDINGLHKVAIFSRENLPGPVRSNKVKLFIDVDPENML